MPKPRYGAEDVSGTTGGTEGTAALVFHKRQTDLDFECDDAGAGATTTGSSDSTASRSAV